MTSLADRLYALILEGLVFLGANPVECSAVAMLQSFSLILILLVCAAIAFHRFGGTLLERRAQSLDDARLEAILQSAVRKTGLHYTPRLLQPPAGAPPVFTAGGHRGVIYLHPELASRLDDGEVEAVLLHELAHLSERDQLFASWLHVLAFFTFAIIVQAAIVAFFFQRDSLHFGSFRAQVLMCLLFLAYLAIRSFFRNALGYLREIDCDDAALSWGARAEDLASALVTTGRLKLEQRRTPWLPVQTALAPRRHDLESRVRRLVRPGRRSVRPRIILRRLMLCVLACLLLFVASFHIRSSASSNPPSGWSQIVVP